MQVWIRHAVAALMLGVSVCPSLSMGQSSPADMAALIDSANQRLAEDDFVAAAAMLRVVAGDHSPLAERALLGLDAVIDALRVRGFKDLAGELAAFVADRRRSKEAVIDALPSRVSISEAQKLFAGAAKGEVAAPSLEVELTESQRAWRSFFAGTARAISQNLSAGITGAANREIIGVQTLALATGAKPTELDDLIRAARQTNKNSPPNVSTNTSGPSGGPSMSAPPAFRANVGGGSVLIEAPEQRISIGGSGTKGEREGVKSCPQFGPSYGQKLASVRCSCTGAGSSFKEDRDGFSCRMTQPIGSFIGCSQSSNRCVQM
jgi:hypothetical protein